MTRERCCGAALLAIAGLLGACGDPLDRVVTLGDGDRLTEVRIVGVEPSGAAAMKASLEAGEPVTLSRTDSVADGLMPVRPGDLTFAHAREYVDEVVTVDDAQIIDAVMWLFTKAKIVAEPSGAATVS